jgi:hypothetical protein
LTLRYLTIAKYAAESGYSEKAIRRKIEDGVWLELREYRRAPDGHIMINVEGVERWVEGRQEMSRRGRIASASASPSQAAAA